MHYFTLTYRDGVLVAGTKEGKSLSQVRRMVELGKPLATIRQFVRLHLEAQDPHIEVKKRWYEADEAGRIAIENGTTEVYIGPVGEDPGGWQMQDVPENAHPWLARYRGEDVDEAIVEPEHVVTQGDIDSFLASKHTEPGVKGGSHILWRTIGDLLQRIDETTQEAIRAASPALWNRFMSLERVFLADPEYTTGIAQLHAASVITQQEHDDLLNYDDPV